MCVLISTYAVVKTKAKTGARNGILKKAANSNWGTDARTIRTGTGRCKAIMQKWGYNGDPNGQTTCECGDEQTMKLTGVSLSAPILPQPCTREDLEEFNPRHPS